MPLPTLAIFDMAGTTVQDDNEVERCFLEAADATGLMVERDRIVDMMGWSKKQVFQTLWAKHLGEQPSSDSARAVFAASVDASYAKFKAILEDHYRTQPVRPTEGCLELFGWLRAQGVLIGLNTGFYRQVTDIILHRLGWDIGLDTNYVSQAESLIQVSVTPSEIHNSEGRPAPFMIQKAMYRLGVQNPQTVMVVGDTPSDLAAGMNAHCGLVYGVTNGSHTQAQLSRYPNHGLFESLAQLQVHLQQKSDARSSSSAAYTARENPLEDAV